MIKPQAFCTNKTVFGEMANNHYNTLVIPSLICEYINETISEEEMPFKLPLP